MTAETMKQLREAAGITQVEMADRMGLGRTAYLDLEDGDGDWKKFKRKHLMMLERASLTLALEKGDINLAIPSIRRDALELARMITGHDQPPQGPGFQKGPVGEPKTGRIRVV